MSSPIELEKRVSAITEAASRLVDETTREKNPEGKDQYRIDVLAKRGRNKAANQALNDLAAEVRNLRTYLLVEDGGGLDVDTDPAA